ncbi:hypothetical protein LguiA_028093 [Lonicera macranthoides]
MIPVSTSKTLIYILPRQFFCLFMGSVKDEFFMDHCRRVLNLYTSNSLISFVSSNFILSFSGNL